MTPSLSETRPTRRGLLVTSAAAVLVGCAPRAHFTASAVPGDAQTRTVVLATNRNATANSGIGSARGEHLKFAAIDVAIPKERYVGASPFATAGHAFSVDATREIRTDQALGQEVSASPDDDLTIWVHGFNTTPAEAVYRQAQMAEDFKMSGPQVAFVWPSAERGVGYLHDRDSVLHARAPFERLIRLLARSRRGRITIVAHSLGSLLVMESLRQAALSGRPLDAVLSGVVLVQPDLDPDVFRAQLRDIGPSRPPMALIVAQNDPVLRLSARLSGRPRRLGATDDLEAFRALGLLVIDLTDVNDAGNAHFTAATSPSAIALIRGLRQSTTFEELVTNDR